jgi:hypothetical protein
MRTQADRVPSLPLLIAGIVAILLGTSGFAAVTAWMPASTPPEGDTRPTVKCAGCGVIASMRESQQPATGIDFRGESTRSYEVTVRMNDGSSHVFMDAKPANWRPGQRVILVEGKSNLRD